MNLQTSLRAEQMLLSLHKYSFYLPVASFSLVELIQWCTGEAQNICLGNCYISQRKDSDTDLP